MRVFVTGSFDDLRSHHIRFLHEASRLGALTVLLWPDEMVKAETDQLPKFPLAERRYLLQAIRYVHQVIVAPGSMDPDEPQNRIQASALNWVMRQEELNPHRQQYCARQGIRLHTISTKQLAGFPSDDPAQPVQSSETTTKQCKKAIVTGSFDWLHSGHVRFFEEASQLGDLYVAVGHDANIRLLKGEGHPLFPQEERHYQVQAIRYVTQAIITSGHGWLDAEPEIQCIKPDVYVVNEDGDKPEKRQYCAIHGIEYLVLQRTPAPGLPRRESTNLRGF